MSSLNFIVFSTLLPDYFSLFVGLCSYLGLITADACDIDCPKIANFCLKLSKLMF